MSSASPGHGSSADISEEVECGLDAFIFNFKHPIFTRNVTESDFSDSDLLSTTAEDSEDSLFEENDLLRREIEIEISLGVTYQPQEREENLVKSLTEDRNNGKDSKPIENVQVGHEFGDIYRGNILETIAEREGDEELAESVSQGRNIVNVTEIDTENRLKGTAEEQDRVETIAYVNNRTRRVKHPPITKRRPIPSGLHGFKFNFKDELFVRALSDSDEFDDAPEFQQGIEKHLTARDLLKDLTGCCCCCCYSD